MFKSWKARAAAVALAMVVPVVGMASPAGAATGLCGNSSATNGSATTQTFTFQFTLPGGSITAGTYITISAPATNASIATIIDGGAPTTVAGPASGPVSYLVPTTITGSPSGSVGLKYRWDAGPGETVSATCVHLNLTSLSTSLSGGGSTGAQISVAPNTPVTDTTTLTGDTAWTATGKVTYSVYSDSNCQTAVSTGSPKTITTPGVLPASDPVSFPNVGTFYWQASYSGDGANAPSTSTCGDEVETVSPVAVGPTCTMGAGIPVAGKPNKNVGTIKIGPGVTHTGATKKVTLNFSGTLENCTNMTGVVSKYPISAGAMKMQVQVGSGSSCAALFNGTPVKTKLSLIWKGLNAKGKLAGAAPTDNSTLSSVSETTSDPRGFDASSAAFAGKKSVFAGMHAALHIVVDESAATISSSCGAKGGLKVLHFTGVNGISTVEMQP